MGKSILRNKKKKKVVTINDYIYPLTKLKQKTYEISDHVNLSGFNPLKGPMFVSLTDLYVTNTNNAIKVAGLKEGVIPSTTEKKILLKAGIKAFCYKLVSKAIMQAAKGNKVRAIGKVARCQ